MKKNIISTQGTVLNIKTFENKYIFLKKDFYNSHYWNMFNHKKLLKERHIDLFKLRFQ
jgi:hypothetical protein